MFRSRILRKVVGAGALIAAALAVGLFSPSTAQADHYRRCAPRHYHYHYYHGHHPHVHYGFGRAYYAPRAVYVPAYDYYYAGPRVSFYFGF